VKINLVALFGKPKKIRHKRGKMAFAFVDEHGVMEFVEEGGGTEPDRWWVMSAESHRIHTSLVGDITADDNFDMYLPFEVWVRED
jgi:hypothetical protein